MELTHSLLMDYSSSTSQLVKGLAAERGMQRDKLVGRLNGRHVRRLRKLLEKGGVTEEDVDEMNREIEKALSDQDQVRFIALVGGCALPVICIWNRYVRRATRWY